LNEEEEWPSLDEARFLLVRGLLEEFPDLRRRIIAHIKRIYPEEID